VLDAAGRVLADEGALFAVDYLALADARSYAPVRDDEDFRGAAVLAIAARIGSTRLIDNVVMEFGTEQHAAGD
jgi:pantoate--beta-alanine ligase